MQYISFPGLGIEPFHIDKAAFSIFGHDIAWYGILITCGMVLAVLLAMRLCRYEGISADDIADLALTVIICGVIGARAYYVIFSWNEMNYVATGGNFFQNLGGTLYNIIAIWEGGLAIYGGVIAGLISGYVFSRIKKIEFLKIADILAPCVLVGQIIGRWGNFVNMEAYGEETTLPWRMGLLYGSPDGWITEKYVHPTFLYESLWNLVILVVILSLYKKKKFNGQMCALYFIWYGFGRFLIEGLRTDSLMLGSLRISQCVGLLSCLAGMLIFVNYFVKAKKKKADGVVYNSVYSDVTGENKADSGSGDNKDESDIINKEEKSDGGEEK